MIHDLLILDQLWSTSVHKTQYYCSTFEGKTTNIIRALRA